MADLIAIKCRYDTKREDGQTRREYNESFGKGDLNPPELDIPQAYLHLWNWYFSLSNTLLRVKNGIVYPIPPTEFQAWVNLTGNIVYPSEYAILCAMDEAFCRETSEEVKAFQARNRPETPPPRAGRKRNGK